MKDTVVLVARVLLAVFFLFSAVRMIAHLEGTESYMASAGMPMTRFFLAGAIVLLLAGGVSLVLGYRLRLGVLALILFLVPATLIFHRFWSLPAAEQAAVSDAFMRNLSLMGGLLMAWAHGAGRFALDARGAR